MNDDNNCHAVDVEDIRPHIGHQTESLDQVDAESHGGIESACTGEPTRLSQYIGEDDQRDIEDYARTWHLD